MKNNLTFLKDFFLNAITKAINAILHLDPDSESRLKDLKDKVITIELLPFHFKFQLIFSDLGIKVQEGDTLTFNTAITGTPLQMLAMLQAPDARHRFFSDDLTITGDALLGQKVVQLFDELSIDWEECLSHLIGDIPTHYASQMFKQVNSWMRQTQQSMVQNVNEYMHEELTLFPTPEELQDFFYDIDELQAAADRIAARINHLSRKISKDSV